MTSIWTYRFSLFLLFCVVVLILAGGLVTSHEAGLAVPDWPLSYGQFFPPMVGNIFWEHGHRMIAGAVGILTLFLAGLIQKTESRAWLKKLGWIAVGAVLLQALLGGLTVLYLLPPAVSILHACLAQTFFCLVLAISYFLSPLFNSAGVPPIPDTAQSQFRRMMILTVSLIYLQLILGAITRHTGKAIAFHVILAFVVVFLIAAVCSKILHLADDQKTHPSLPLMRTAALGWSLTAIIQIFLGFGSFIFTRMLERSYAPSRGEVLFTAAHQTTGALVLGLGVFILLRVWR